MVLPCSMRLKGHRCFDHIYKSGIRYHGSSMVLRVVHASPGLMWSHNHQCTNNDFRIAIAISGKVSKKAVIRNRLRRLLHEYLKRRLSGKNKICNNWALISLKPNSITKRNSVLLEECDTLLNKAGFKL